jgi:hypothetical protein
MRESNSFLISVSIIGSNKGLKDLRFYLNGLVSLFKGILC